MTINISLNVFNKSIDVSSSEAYEFYTEKARLLAKIRELTTLRSVCTGQDKGRVTRERTKTENVLAALLESYDGRLPQKIKSTRLYLDHCKRIIDRYMRTNSRTIMQFKDDIHNADVLTVANIVSGRFKKLLAASLRLSTWEWSMPESDETLDDYLVRLNSQIEYFMQDVLLETGSGYSTNSPYAIEAHVENATRAAFVTSRASFKTFVDDALEQWDSFVMFNALEQAGPDMTFVKD